MCVQSRTAARYARRTPDVATSASAQTLAYGYPQQGNTVVMAKTVSEVVEAFDVFYQSIFTRDFRKSVRLDDYSENELLPLVRSFLLGYFVNSLVPEASTELPGKLSGYGRVDFLIDNVAVEFAVRRREDRSSPIRPSVNADEMKKLMKYDGLSLLVLYDFSANPLDETGVEDFREWPSLGKGNHYRGPVNIAYFYRSSFRPIETDCIRKNIRPT